MKLYQKPIITIDSGLVKASMRQVETTQPTMVQNVTASA